MTTKTNYILIATLGNENYSFNYECNDVLEALEYFWHNDYVDCLADRNDSDYFPIDVLAMEQGKVIYTYKFALNASLFHHYFDNGRVTIEEFDASIRTMRKKMKTN